MEVAITERVREAYANDARPLWRAVFAYAGRREVADDAVAEAFAQVLRRGNEVRDIRRWVWRAAFRIAAGELQAARRTTPDMTECPVEDPRLVELLADLAILTDQQRQCALLHYVGNYKPREIAEVLGTSS